MNTDHLFYWPAPKRAWRRRVGVAAGFFVGVSMLCTGVVMAWPSPDTDAMGGACQGGQRTPVTWLVYNRETGNPGSPATIHNVHVSGGFGVTTFAPQPLPNNGVSYATAITVVPSSFEGNVTLTYMMVWSGTDGHDSRTGSVAVHVSKCECPPTTSTTVPVTSTPVPQTTTTVAQTTTTTAPAATTTTTAPSTTTTVPATSTSTTAAPTTSTTAEAGMPLLATSTTVVPSSPSAPVLAPPVPVVRPTELPVTGSETVPLMLIAAGLIVLGVLALYEARRMSR